MRAESHCCEVNTIGILACNFTMFFKVFKGIHFRKSLAESILARKFSKKITEHVQSFNQVLQNINAYILREL